MDLPVAACSALCLLACCKPHCCNADACFVMLCFVLAGLTSFLQC